MCAVKKVIWTFRLPVIKDKTNIQCVRDDMMQMRKSATGDVHNMAISTNNHTTKAYTTFRSTCMAVLKMARNVFAPCPYFRDLHGRKLKDFE